MTSLSDQEKKSYSDEELQEFKELIIKKLHSAREELDYLQQQIKSSSEELVDGKFMGLDDGSVTLEKEHLNKLASRQVQYIQYLENALIRIENKTYGICRVTGKLISKERLKAVPHATLSIEAKLNGSK
ncbi:MAG: TraR/DksA C4-type zinc finger protein [Chitinophagales bacterium]|nr:TraR/DksA C4-type zinc finger protein [Bacteroidota bacterium]MCB9044098.1 TraR/DksA C4-type zinc finger protein [Chitinophagales bacterium]